MTAVTYTSPQGEQRSRLLPSTLAPAFISYLKGVGAEHIVVDVLPTSIRTEESHD